jgi:basic membrane lipoprotein Med (substrate-binding protein (PBP1-ABC) superfamily)
MRGWLVRWLPLVLVGCAPEGGLSTLLVSVHYPVAGTGVGGLSSAMQRGVLEARVGSNFVVEEHRPESEQEAREQLEETLTPRRGRHLVIAGGEIYASALDAHDCALGGSEVLLLDSKPRPCDGLRSVVLEGFAPAFLAGVLALSAESIAPHRLAGAISTAPSTEVTRLLRGFQAGSEYVGGNVQTLQLDALAPDAAAAALRSLADAVDVLLVAGDAANSLVLQAVREHNAQNPEQTVRLIGLDQDLSVREAELVLGSVVRRYDAEVRSSILAAQVGAFAPGQVVRGYSDEQTELLINPAYAEQALTRLPFDGCAPCQTLVDAVEQAAPAAQAAAAPGG